MFIQRSVVLKDKRLYPEGKTIFAQGDSGDAAFVVESGIVGLYRKIGALEVRIGEARDGALFGEMAVIDGQPRMATARADSAVTLIRIPRAIIEQKMARSDPFIRGIVQMFLRLLRKTHEDYVRKPRSMSDSVRMMDAYASGIQDYVGRIPTSSESGEMAQLATDLRLTLARMATLSKTLPDRRESVVSENDTDGVQLREAMAAE